ncbi:MAG: hypothetical protein H0W78_09465 [Planctomycetes bacterium]|nr:hypothetical protein [Planctomycetota bacterium]
MTTSNTHVFAWPRRGNALVATLIISATVGLVLNLSSERLQGLQASSSTDHAKLEARLAAESLAAIIEGRLRERGAEDTAFLTKRLDASGPTTYGSSLEIAGYANSTDTTTRGIRIGNCMVWWRVEPVKVWSETVKELSATADGLYAINPNMDDQNASLDARYKAAVASDSLMFKDNDRNFLFRIVTEAYSLKDPTYIYNVSNPGYNPRNNAELRKASAQASRVVQYTLVNLFEYAIFYAAEGTTGDLEFWQGTGMAVKGRVHSNGAIYIGGGGQAYMSNQFHSAASGNGGLSIGSATEPTTVTAVDGVYRMRKPANYVSVIKNMHPQAYFDPYKVPTIGLGGELNLNGDTPSDGRHTINGRVFTSANDSRSTAIDNRMLNDFGRRVSDKFTGTKVVQSLANVPKFKGRPLEPDLLGGLDDTLFGDPTMPIVLANLSLNQAHPDFGGRGAPLYYSSDPRATNTPGLTFAPALAWGGNPDAARVSAYNLPLFRQDDKMERRLDIHNPGTLVELAQDSNDTEADFTTGTRTILLHNQLRIDSKTNRTGLVIRERRIPRAPSVAFPAAHPFPTVGGFPDAPTAIQLAAMRDYLIEQYQVRFYGADITDEFFADLTKVAATGNMAPCTTKAQAIVTEDFFINRRESNFMGMFFAQNMNDYRINLITLNLRRIQEFLANSRMSDLGITSAAVASNLAKQHFNGVVYIHRTRRSQTFHPLDRTRWWFNTTVRADFNPPAQVALPGGIAAGAREKDGPIESFHAGVRVRGGLVADGANRDHMASVNWQHDTDNDGLPNTMPLGTSKMTIITPNPMYLWGDINTTPYSDGTKNQRVPFAVFADSMTLLSARWSDASVNAYNVGTPRPFATHTSYVTSFVINNMPCREWNAVSEGSGAVANVCRFLENWGGGGNPGGVWPLPLKNMPEHPGGMPRPPTYGGQVVFTFMGSLVVMNEQRYGRGVLGAGSTNLNDTSFYSPPFRNLAYNTDLKLAAGQPPEALRALETTRVVSTVNMFDN